MKIAVFNDIGEQVEYLYNLLGQVKLSTSQRVEVLIQLNSLTNYNLTKIA